MSKAKASLASFRAAYDKNVILPEKIRAGLASLEKEHGPEGWEHEAQFIKRVGTSTTDFALFRDQFDKHVVNVASERAPKRVWFATEKAAKAARGA